jgi:hypothetical protein
MKILVTGSRTWTDTDVIHQVLRRLAQVAVDLDEVPVLISGNCPTGADAIAEEFWARSPYPMELHPADWHQYGKRAGFVRNAQMVKLEPDVCVAFCKNGSKGTTMCGELAETAGIYTIWIER